ncbi:ornithine cyclodeaminase/alanine dehydrogenase-like protein (mu-crystallin family) [Streptomyces phaeochromogenes]|jgi:ornithine cyclodeaminase/alanine dehydrogenase-like protein (mu-crystallin family)|uniref:ornithine cyclodeaminase family protein n=1 Tax=Streptomyces phaeochromogenes TaxID=1923 RepID=UPI00278FF1AB|nr:ornithine cyclodeaminase family protein [Streptomyces phaeochromogenes]MDQ0948268.1 ornithine cyclodeaminase/alanine dehydrogenase-like protein (mu-crystallin family) [Streptomyces phaeochromogenes]
MTDDVLHLSRDQVAALLDTDTAIRSQRAAFTALGDGTAELPGKIMHPSGFDDSVVFAYLARLSADTGAVAKIGSVNPGNAAAGLPTIHAVINALDPVTGQLVAVMDGTAVTTLRTAAASAVALDALATPDSAELGLIGSGTQALAHARSVARVRDLRAVRIWSPSPERRARAARLLAAELGIPVKAVDSAEEAVAGLPMVAACTLSSTPVVRGEWLAPGCTVVSVGSFEPGRSEVDTEVVRRAAAVVVDDPETAADHAGPIVDALRSGKLTHADLIPLGEVLTGRREGRTAERDIVYYNSVGIGIQDAAAAWAVIDAARAQGVCS